MQIQQIDTHDFGVGVSGGNRSDGLHVSEIYKSLMHDLEPKRFKNDGVFDMEKLELGLSFETMLEIGLQQRLFPDLVRPGEIISDEGIKMSPDGLIFDPLTLLEFKATWMSCRDGIEHDKFYVWFVQMKAYCRELHTRDAMLWAFFVNGDYTHPYKPELHAYQIRFTTLELEENWQMLTRHAVGKGMLSEVQLAEAKRTYTARSRAQGATC